MGLIGRLTAISSGQTAPGAKPHGGLTTPLDTCGCLPSELTGSAPFLLPAGGGSYRAEVELYPNGSLARQWWVGMGSRDSNYSLPFHARNRGVGCGLCHTTRSGYAVYLKPNWITNEAYAPCFRARTIPSGCVSAVVSCQLVTACRPTGLRQGETLRISSPHTSGDADTRVTHWAAGRDPGGEVYARYILPFTRRLIIQKIITRRDGYEGRLSVP